MLIEGRIVENSQSEKKFFEYYRHKERLNRIKPKILIRHEKIIEQMLKKDENKNLDVKSKKIQLDLFGENLN
uniref:Uncharacterized protein n=1 Tax=candidate division WOR-3 bacterium TaxID=2052148 RepID=A0A7V0Z5G3_UNCW3